MNTKKFQPTNKQTTGSSNSDVQGRPLEGLHAYNVHVYHTARSNNTDH